MTLTLPSFSPEQTSVAAVSSTLYRTNARQDDIWEDIQCSAVIRNSYRSKRTSQYPCRQELSHCSSWRTCQRERMTRSKGKEGKTKIMPPCTLCHPTGLSALPKSLWILSDKPFHYYPEIQRIDGNFQLAGSSHPLCLLSGSWRRHICPPLSFCDGKCGMDLAYIGFFMIKEGCLCPEQPQVIIIQFILLLWFFIQFT